MVKVQPVFSPLSLSSLLAYFSIIRLFLLFLMLFLKELELHQPEKTTGTLKVWIQIKLPVTLWGFVCGFLPESV